MPYNLSWIFLSSRILHSKTSVSNHLPVNTCCAYSWTNCSDLVNTDFSWNNHQLWCGGPRNLVQLEIQCSLNELLVLGILLLFSRQKIRRYFNFRVKQCECQAVHYNGFKSVSDLAGVVITISVGLLLDKLGWQIWQSNSQSDKRIIWKRRRLQTEFALPGKYRSITDVEACFSSDFIYHLLYSNSPLKNVVLYEGPGKYER